jgi:hypothetical protein
LDTRPNYDRPTERVICGEAGVREFWTVERGYYVEAWTGDGLRQVVRVEDSLTSGLLPGFLLDLKSLFREG